MTALILSGAAANGDIFTTGVAGLGVKLYYYNGLTRVQLAPNIQVSVAATLSGPGTVSTVEAELVVTGQVSSGTLNALPSVNLTFLAAGAGCGVVTLADKTLTVTAGNGTVTASSCVVTSPAIAVGLPTVSTQQLDAAGKTAGLTQFTIPLNCSSVTADVYVTLTDATDASNTTSLLTLQPAATAGNVKLQILRNNGTAVSYGPDAATAGNTNQFFVGPASTVSNIPLGVQYYSTGVATAGSVHAAATFTMSYQ
ncbi:fimbrial protein [Sphingomonas sp. NFR15]|uniref:fimbrial protein n=1 Tax=Sphingomonas sp. NFR15 TaxID=1566282 RepID=UPI0015A18687|nr:fimbrial protein [Sphingomonas sp. NFR15]